MLLRDPSRYEGNQAWRVHPARKSAGWFIRGTSSASVSLEKQLFPFKLRRIASTLGCVSRGRLPLLWTRSTVVYSILVALSQKRRSTLRANRGLEIMFRTKLTSGWRNWFELMCKMCEFMYVLYELCSRYVLFLEKWFCGRYLAWKWFFFLFPKGIKLQQRTLTKIIP